MLVFMSSRICGCFFMCFPSVLPEVLLWRRPATGLLAGQWEFPAAVLPSPPAAGAGASAVLAPTAAAVHHAWHSFAAGALAPCCERGCDAWTAAAAAPDGLVAVGLVSHVFSHLKHTLHVCRQHVVSTTPRTGQDVCLQLDRHDLLPVEDDVDADADEEPDQPVATKKHKKTAAVAPAPAPVPADATEWTARWVRLSDSSALGLTLSTQKVLELVTGRPFQRKHVTAAAAAAAPPKHTPAPAVPVSVSKFF